MGELSVTSLGGGVYRVTHGGRNRLAYAAGPDDARWVFLEGRVWVVDVEDRSPEGLRHLDRGAEQLDTVGTPAEPGASTVAERDAPTVAQPFRAATKRRHDEGALTAPMPATVVSINVVPGQRVSKGDVLVMLEAMKMELPLKSPRDAKVAAIACRTGELVQPGVPLLELE